MGSGDRLDDERIPAEIPTAPRLAVDFDGLERLETIGKGGNADVYRVRHPRDGGTVDLALKEPRFQETLSAGVVERFEREATTWADLDDHDHVVGLVDWATEPLPWLALEYMDGGSLRERLADVGRRQGVWTAICVARAVHHAHRFGVVHLDLKPANVLFRETATGRWDAPKVGDWGLARMLLEHSASVEGLSPQYAAPEQFDREEYGDPDDITDVYQLGAIVYEVLTGRPPFEGAATEVMRSVLNSDPEPPTSVDSALPAVADELAATALAKRKADRYESVLYLRDDLVELFEALGGSDAEGSGATGPPAGEESAAAGSGTSGTPAADSSVAGSEESEAVGSPAGREQEASAESAAETGEPTESSPADATGEPTESSSAAETGEPTEPQPTGSSGSRGTTDSSGADGSSRRLLLKGVGAVGGSAVLGGAAYVGYLATGSGGGGGGGGGAIDGPVTLATILPLSGRLRQFGPAMQRAVAVAVAEVNDAGGPGGAKVDLVSTDSESSPSAAVDQYENLVGNHGSDLPGIVGAASSPVSEAIAKRVANDRVMQVTPSSQSPALSGMGYGRVEGERLKFVGRTVASDALLGIAMGERVMAAGEFVGADAASFVHVDNQWGRTVAEAAATAFPGRTLHLVPYSQEASDYTRVLERAHEGDPGAIGFLGYPPGAATMLQQWQNGSYGTAANQWVLTGDLRSSQFLEDYSDVVAGMYLVGASPPAETRSRRSLQRRMPSEHRGAPFTASAYDAAMLMALAMHEAGEASGPAIAHGIRDVATPDGTRVYAGQFERAKELLDEGTPVDYVGASGPLDLTPALQPLQKFGIHAIGPGGQLKREETIPRSAFRE